MLTQIENEKGIISYDNALINQMILDSLNEYKGKYKLIKKDFMMKEQGVEIVISLHLKFGISIQSFCEHCFSFIAQKIENSLELPLYNIKICILGIYSKKLSKRNIVIEYNNKSEISYNGY